MKINNQLEQPLTTPELPGAADVDMAARRPLYHPAARPRLGRVLRGRYRLESLLGMGAMGEVYRAVDLQLQQPCAVKLVFPGAVFGLKAHRRFDNEARVIARLFHPNIVEVRDFNEDEDGTKFLVMELLEGQDLHQLLSRQGRLPLPRALEIIRAVGAALQYAHDMGIVHRDVKPENIFLGTRGRLDGRDGEPGEREQIKVLDFGLAKLLSEPPAGEDRPTDPGGAPAQLTSGIIIGTLAYLSPEATCMDSSGVDARSDQWSLAVVAYQLLSGRLPFGNSHPIGLWQMICSEEPVRLRTLVPGLPAHIDSAIHTALAKQRKDRFPRVADFIRSLGNLPQLGDSASAAATVDCGPPARPPVPTGSTAPIAAVASAAADPMWEGEGDPTEVEPYLPGLTRPRLALLHAPSPAQRSVPEFVEPDHERVLRVPTASPAVSAASPRREQSAPHPDLLVTAHYTAEQLLELSGMVNLRDAQALVHAAQDVPTAPYRLGGRSAKDLDDAFDRTPLPVPRPMLDALSAPVQDDRRCSPEPALARECQLTATLVPTGEPTQPPGASGSVFATLRAELQQQAALPVGLAKAAGLAVSAAPSAPATAGSAAPAPLPAPRSPATPSQAAGRARPPRPPAAAFAEPARRAATSAKQSPPPVPSAPSQAPVMAAPAPRPALQMPALLTLAGTLPPELGSPLQLALPRLRWSLWRALGASSLVLGLLVAALLGLRLVRPRAVSSGAAVPRSPAPLLGSSARPLVELAQVAAPTPDSRAAGRELQPALAPPSAAPPVQTREPLQLDQARQVSEQAPPEPDSLPEAEADSPPESDSPPSLDSLLSSQEPGLGLGQGPGESCARLAE